jgi:hypothetical protein
MKNKKEKERKIKKKRDRIIEKRDVLNFRRFDSSKK